MVYRPFRDLSLKFVSVVLAVLLWTSVVGEPVVERGLEIPLEFENVPVGVEIVGTPPDTLRVRVRGPSSMVSRLGTGQVAAILDLFGEQPGRKLFDMFAGRVEVPSGVEVTSVVPATVVLTLERLGVARAVPVVADIEGDPSPGRTVGRVTTHPSSVEIIGPETRLAELQEALTEPISVQDAISTIVREVSVGVADSTVRLTEPVLARVVIEIVKADEQRTFHDVLVGFEGVDNSRAVSIQPEQVTIGIRGPSELIRRLDQSAVRPYVDLSDLAGLFPDRYNLPVVVESRDEFRITHIDPPSVQVNLR